MVLIELKCINCSEKQFVRQNITEIWYCHYCGKGNPSKKRIRINEKKQQSSIKRNETRSNYC